MSTNIKQNNKNVFEFHYNIKKYIKILKKTRSLQFCHILTNNTTASN